MESKKWNKISDQIQQNRNRLTDTENELVVTKIEMSGEEQNRWRGLRSYNYQL